MVKVAINGFGRIGRNTLRAAVEKGIFDKLDYAAINDPGVNPDQAAFLLKYDSVHRKFCADIKSESDGITINGKKIRLFAEKDPSKLPWKELGVEIALECSGFFSEASKAKMHIDAGARKVIISTTSKDADKTICLGINQNVYDPSKDNILSMASCTTNCLAPMAKVLHENFGIIDGLMTTVHAYTGDQRILDTGHKDMRRARAAAINIIPTSTGAARAIGKVIPDLNGKLNGVALRVPVPDVSITDLVANTEKPVSIESVNEVMKKAAESELKGIMCYSEEPLVSTDYTGTHYSCIFDSKLTMPMGEKMIKVFGWYDNEMGYSTRLAEFSLFVANKL